MPKRAYPGAVTPATPDVLDVLDAADVGEGVGVGGWLASGSSRVTGCWGALFPSRQAQRFLGVHSAAYNLFNLGRHLIRAEHYRNLREGAFSEWNRAVA